VYTVLFVVSVVNDEWGRGGDEKRDFFNKTENLFVGEGLLEVGFKENLWYLCIFHSVLTQITK